VTFSSTSPFKWSHLPLRKLTTKHPSKAKYYNKYKKLSPYSMSCSFLPKRKKASPIKKPLSLSLFEYFLTEHNEIINLLNSKIIQIKNYSLLSKKKKNLNLN
jgi:hypothetical protein